jgi:oligosaccharide repeat unit polymerase
MPTSLTAERTSAATEAVCVFAGLTVLLLLLLGGFYAAADDSVTPLSIVVLVGGSSVTSACFYLNRDILAPSVLISGIWTMTLFVASFDVQYVGRYHVFNFPINGETWALMIGAIFSFLVGCILTTVSCSQPSRQRRHQTSLRYSDRRLRQFTQLCLLIGFGSYVVCYLFTGTIPMFAQNVNEVRGVFRVDKFGLLLSLLVVAVILYGYRLGNGGLLRNWKALLLCFFCLFLMLSTTQRADSFQAFVAAAVTFELRRRSRAQLRRTKREVVALVLASAILGAAFIHVGNLRSIADRGVEANDVVDIDNKTLAQIYIYSYVPSIKNFQWGREQNIEHSYGVIASRPLLWLTGRLDRLPPDVDFGGLNTATWLWNYYRDFGVAGTLLFPMLLGSVSTLAYQKAKSSESVFAVTAYGLLVSCIVWTGGTDRFFEVLTFILLVILWCVDFGCRQPATRTNRLMRRSLGPLPRLPSRTRGMN